LIEAANAVNADPWLQILRDQAKLLFFGGVKPANNKSRSLSLILFSKQVELVQADMNSEYTIYGVSIDRIFFGNR
jgi:hypothetical protein